MGVDFIMLSRSIRSLARIAVRPTRIAVRPQYLHSTPFRLQQSNLTPHSQLLLTLQLRFPLDYSRRLHSRLTTPPTRSLNFYRTLSRRVFGR